MTWRWRNGHGMEALMEGMPGYMRRRYLGKWNGHKGAAYASRRAMDPAPVAAGRRPTRQSSETGF